MDAPREVTGHQFACHLSPHIACLLRVRPQPRVGQRLVVRPQTCIGHPGTHRQVGTLDRLSLEAAVDCLRG